jgi:hypothetical protein
VTFNRPSVRSSGLPTVEMVTEGFVVGVIKAMIRTSTRLAGSLASRVQVLHLQGDHPDTAGKPAG